MPTPKQVREDVKAVLYFSGKLEKALLRCQRHNVTAIDPGKHAEQNPMHFFYGMMERFEDRTVNSRAKAFLEEINMELDK